MIKLIVSDIDGTLVPDGKSADSLNKKYYEVINELLGQGVMFAACSGRQYESIRRVFEPIGERIYYISEGGGFVSDGKKNLLYSATLDPYLVRELVADAKKLTDLDVMITGFKHAYCTSEDSEMYRWMVNDYGFDIKAIGDLEKGVDDMVAKVSLYHRELAEELTRDTFVPKWRDRVKTTVAGIQWLDCVSFDSGKGNALEKLRRHLGIKKEETVVFGDNLNDIEMFERAGISYAVMGARDEVKNAATYVCPGMEDDGVLQILSKISDDLQK